MQASSPPMFAAFVPAHLLDRRHGRGYLWVANRQRKLFPGGLTSVLHPDDFRYIARKLRQYQGCDHWLRFQTSDMVVTAYPLNAVAGLAGVHVLLFWRSIFLLDE